LQPLLISRNINENAQRGLAESLQNHYFSLISPEGKGAIFFSPGQALELRPMGSVPFLNHPGSKE
jgi:hypothetical protein